MPRHESQVAVNKKRDARKKKATQDKLIDQRAKLSTANGVFHITKIIKRLEGDEELDMMRIGRLKIALEARIRLLGKTMPDLKQIEVKGTGGGQRLLIDIRPKEERERDPRQVDDDSLDSLLITHTKVVPDNE
jgi:hypothetical protein